MSTTYVTIDDGQTKWTANLDDLVRGLRACGYRAEEYHGYLTVVEPPQTDDEDAEYAYSELCSKVPPIEGVTETETDCLMDYREDVDWRWVVSYGLYKALWDAQCAAEAMG